MSTLRATSYIQQHLQKGQQKLRSIFQCQMTLLLLLFQVQETLGHLTIKRRLGRKRRQEVVLTVMTRYIGVLSSFLFSYTHILQDESYARPTAVGSYQEGPLSRRCHQPHPSSFTALSSVAMDELYLLEQEEALRRAEYETRHAEALRRAESQSRQSQVAPSAFYSRPRYRLSKSATTSPIMTNALTLGPAPVTERSSVFPLSTDRCSYPSPLTESTRPSTKRRLSGPAWPSPQQQQKDSPLTQSRSSGHLVDSMRASTFNHHHGTWSRPYQPDQNHHLEAVNGRTDGSHSPSPISSDSEHPGHDGLHKTQSPPKMFHLHGPSAFQSRSSHMPNRSLDSYSPPLYSSSAVHTTPSSDFAFTPSTSPFLGPMRTLNIHSTTPSRAPSPIFLPPGHEDEAARLPLSHSRAGSVAYGSPPLTSNSFVHRKQHQRGDGHSGSSPHYGCVSSQPPPLSMPRNTSWSASSSGPWQGLSSIQHHHHHPSHSLYNHQHQRGVNPSLPSSRSGSPPIRLPPLKMLPSTDASTATISNLAPHSSSNSHSALMEDPTENPSDSVSTDQQQTVRVKKEKVELPGFSEFEAATRGVGGLSTASSSAPTAIGADARMSIDFVR